MIKMDEQKVTFDSGPRLLLKLSKCLTKLNLESKPFYAQSLSTFHIETIRTEIEAASHI